MPLQIGAAGAAAQAAQHVDLDTWSVSSADTVFEGTEADPEMTDLTDAVAPAEMEQAPERLGLAQEAGAAAVMAHVPTGSEIEWGAHLPPETRAEVEAMRSAPPR